MHFFVLKRTFSTRETYDSLWVDLLQPPQLHYLSSHGLLSEISLGTLFLLYVSHIFESNIAIHWPIIFFSCYVERRERIHDIFLNLFEGKRSSELERAPLGDRLGTLFLQSVSHTFESNIITHIN